MFGEKAEISSFLLIFSVLGRYDLYLHRLLPCPSLLLLCQRLLPLLCGCVSGSSQVEN